MTSLVDSLHHVVPANRILTRDADRAAYDADAQTAFRCRAAAAALPQTTDELAALVKWCHAEKVPFVVRGSGTGLSAGATPVSDGIVIVTTSLQRIRRLDPVQRIAVVEPGVVNSAVSAAAAAHGLFFAPDPSSQPICTIGGNIGFNAGGAHCFKYGMTSNHVLGLKAVLASGEIVEWGGSTRDFVGPDWTGLFVGNEGLFGVVLEATLNLLPLPDGCHTVLAGFDSASAAGDAVSAIIASGLVPVAMELMDGLTIEAVRPVVPIAYPPDCEALLLVELEGPGATVAAETPVLENLLRAARATGLISARDTTERANIWRVRKSAYSAYGRLAPNNFVQDSVVPRRHLGEALRRVESIAATAGLQCPNVCHAGDGNLHPNLLYDGEKPGEFERAEQAAGEILKMCVELGGSITGEHGVGLEKRHYLELMYGNAELELFHQLHRAFDPQRIANPGKMLPECRKTETTVPPPAPAKDTGITAYEPTEFVLSAMAATPLSEITGKLAAHRQQLIFDPLQTKPNLTLGEAILQNLNGPGALGGGRVRDAILEVKFSDGQGRRFCTGARVVKNVAGFDVPKLLVGSMGSIAALEEVTIKVGPAPESSAIVETSYSDSGQLPELLAHMANLATQPNAIEADPVAQKVWVRFGAPGDAIDPLVASVEQPSARRLPSKEAQDVEDFWRNLTWARADFSITKLPVGLHRLAAFLSELTQFDHPPVAHLSLAADVAYLAGEGEMITDLRTRLSAAGFSSQLLRGEGPRLIQVGTPPDIEQRVRAVFQPRDPTAGPATG